MRLLVVLSLALAALAISVPELPQDAMLHPPEDYSDDIGEGDRPPPEPSKIPPEEDPNMNPGKGREDDDSLDAQDPDEESMIQKPPPDYNGQQPQAEGDDANLLQTGEGSGSDAASDSDAASGSDAAPAGGASGSGSAAPAGPPAGAAGSGSGSSSPPANGPPGAGDLNPSGGGGAPAGDTGANAAAAGPPPSGGGSPAPPAGGDGGGGGSRGPLGRMKNKVVNRPKETADPLYSSGTKINKSNAKIYKKVDYSPAKATERAVLKEAQRVINKAKSKHEEFLEDTKEEIEKMLEA